MRLTKSSCTYTRSHQFTHCTISGTSTGAVLATLLGVRQYSASQAENVYKNFASCVFRNSSPEALLSPSISTTSSPLPLSPTISSPYPVSSFNPSLSSSPPPYSILPIPSSSSSSSLSPSLGAPPSSDTRTAWFRFAGWMQLFKSGAYYKSGPIASMLAKFCGIEKMIDTNR